MLFCDVPFLERFARAAQAGFTAVEFQFPYAFDVDAIAEAGRTSCEIVDAVDLPNVFVQYDIYHAQRMEGELAATIERHLARIGHLQIADNSGRHEPGTGEINFPFLFEQLDRIGYRGWIGCEYRPLTTTEAGLAALTFLTNP